jgi:cell division protein FtsB
MKFLSQHKKKGKFGLILLLGLPIVGYVLLNPHGVIQRVRLEVAKREMQEKLKEAELEHQRLEDYSKKLENDKRTIEKVAREKYGMVREGEKVYKVKKEE